MKKLLIISSLLAIFSNELYAMGDDKKSETKKTVTTTNTRDGVKKDVTETKKVVENKAGDVKKETEKVVKKYN